MKRRVLVGVVGAGVAAAAGAYLLLDLLKTPPAPRVAVAETKPELLRTNNADQRWATLPKRESIGRPAGEIFLPQSWNPPAPPPAKVRRVTAKPAPPPPPEKPAAPPVPYRVAGKMLHEDRPQIVLVKGDAVLAVREGDTLDDGYRVVSINADRVTLVYLPLDVQHTLPVTSTFIIDENFAGLEAKPRQAKGQGQSVSAGNTAPAQLSWTGPREVKAGDPFTVALKLSAAQPMQAAPMRLSYDAAILEPVDVRPGKFFLGGLFTYRIADGSILVGASGKESVPSDAELLVVTFKPIRAGTAELKISSMTLQAAGGRPIAHDQPAAFRAAVVR